MSEDALDCISSYAVGRKGILASPTIGKRKEAALFYARLGDFRKIPPIQHAENIFPEAKAHYSYLYRQEEDSPFAYSEKVEALVRELKEAEELCRIIAFQEGSTVSGDLSQLLQKYEAPQGGGRTLVE